MARLLRELGYDTHPSKKRTVGVYHTTGPAEFRAPHALSRLQMLRYRDVAIVSASRLATAILGRSGLARRGSGCALLVSRISTSRRRGSTSSEVPVKPVWPNVTGEESRPMNHGWLSLIPSPCADDHPGRAPE